MTYWKALFCIFLTIILTVYAQLEIKRQISLSGVLQLKLENVFFFYLKILFNPWVIFALFCTFIAGLSWMAAITKIPLSLAYPFVSLTFPAVIFLSAYFFNETLHWQQYAGTVCLLFALFLLQQR